MKDLKKKSAGSQIAKDCVASRVRYLNRIMTSIYDQALRPLGITINQLNVLVAFSQMGQVSAKKVGSFLQMDPSTMSRNLERMRKAGWLRSIPGEDARTVLLSVTPAGSRLIEKALPYWQQAQTRAQELMGEPGIHALIEWRDHMK